MVDDAQPRRRDAGAVVGDGGHDGTRDTATTTAPVIRAPTTAGPSSDTDGSACTSSPWGAATSSPTAPASPARRRKSPSNVRPTRHAHGDDHAATTTPASAGHRQGHDAAQRDGLRQHVQDGEAGDGDDDEAVDARGGRGVATQQRAEHRPDREGAQAGHDGKHEVAL